MVKLNKKVKKDLKKLYESDIRYIRFAQPKWKVF